MPLITTLVLIQHPLSLPCRLQHDNFAMTCWVADVIWIIQWFHVPNCRGLSKNLKYHVFHILGTTCYWNKNIHDHMGHASLSSEKARICIAILQAFVGSILQDVKICAMSYPVRVFVKHRKAQVWNPKVAYSPESLTAHPRDFPKWSQLEFFIWGKGKIN